MPIVSTDLILRLSLNMPEDDVTTTGGAIDPDGRPVFTQLAADDDTEVLSDNGGDTTQTFTGTGRDAGGSITSQGVTLNGTSAVILATMGVIERVLKGLLSADTTGTVTYRRSVGGATIATIPPGERSFHILFYDSSSDPSATQTRYEKIFAENTHATLTLTNAVVELDADPSGVLNIRLEDAINDTNSAADRLTEPTGNGGSWTGVGTEIAVPGNQLAASDHIGTWLRQSLGVGNAPIKNTFDIRVAGTST